MEIRAFKPYFIVIGLMVLTSLALAFTVDVTVTDEAGIKVELPDHVGSWTGDEVRFCQNPVCQKTFAVSQLTNRDVCPACGGKLDSMTKVEKDLLPADTVLLKKQYANPAGQTLFASIVLSGKERASIHRPQICLVGQGNEIVKSRVMSVPLVDHAPVKVMVLDMLRRGERADGSSYEYSSYFAYWFVGKGRETPYHLERMYWMAADRILHNRSHRWAYIAVAGARQGESNIYREQIQDFIGHLHPEIVLD